MEATAGTRFRCENCGSELIVVKAAGGPVLTCCDKPLTPIAKGGAAKPAS